MLSERVMIFNLIIRLIKKTSLYKMSYFAEPYTNSKNKIKSELDLSNYATISVLKKTTSIDPSEFAKRVDLASLKRDADK